MICSKCQLTTDEVDLVDSVCGPCRGAVSRPVTFAEMLNLSQREYRYEPSAVGVEAPREEEPPEVISPQSSHRPSKTVYSVEYRYQDGRKGFMDFSDVSRVERMVRIIAQDGGEVAAVHEARQLVNDEPGGPVELLPVGRWSRQRIDACLLRPGEIYVESRPRHAGLTDILERCRTSYRANKDLTFARQYGSQKAPRFASVKDEIEAVEAMKEGERIADRYLKDQSRQRTRIVTKEQLDEGWTRLVGNVTEVRPYQVIGKLSDDTFEVVDPDPIGETLRSSAASPNFANLRNKESVEEHLGKRCRDLRRVKAFGVDRRHVFMFLSRGCRYVTAEIPEGAEVLEVHDDPMRRMFVFTLRHDSFPPVPEGQVLEMIRPVWNAVEENRYYPAAPDNEFTGNEEIG